MIFTIFALKVGRNMTNIQLIAEMLRNMSIIAEDENLQRRAVKYLRKLVAEKEDATLFTKEEFFQRIDEAKKGPSYELKEGETIEDLIIALQRS